MSAGKVEMAYKLQQPESRAVTAELQDPRKKTTELEVAYFQSCSSKDSQLWVLWLWPRGRQTSASPAGASMRRGKGRAAGRQLRTYSGVLLGRRPDLYFTDPFSDI